MSREPLTVAVINHNGRAILAPTLEALTRVSYRPLELMMVDDGSDDDSVGWVRAHYPRVRVERMPQRAGKPGPVRNHALELARSRYVLLLDHDVRVQPECPALLMRTMTAQPGRTLGVSPRLVYADRPDTLYVDGTNLHYLCVSTSNGRGVKAAERTSTEAFASLAGGNVLLDRELALSLGGYDEAYLFGWGEDAELCVRGRVAGYDVLHLPTAVAAHVERERGTSRAEAQFYNRYRMLLTVYSGRSLLVLTPALMLFELSLLAMAVVQGVAGQHLRAMRRTVLGIGELLRTRRRIQQTRRRSDSTLLEAAPLIATGALARSRIVAVGSAAVEGMFAGYWRLVDHRWWRR